MFHSHQNKGKERVPESDNSSKGNNKIDFLEMVSAQYQAMINNSDVQLKNVENDGASISEAESENLQLKNAPVQKNVEKEEEDEKLFQGKYSSPAGLAISKFHFPINNNPTLESEADQSGKKAAQGETIQVEGVGSDIQMEEDESSQETVEITKGELTTLGEGTSQYIHWPGNSSSGVTIGRGYDIGSRTEEEVIAELVDAGMDQTQAEKIAEGAGLKGDNANTFVTNNKDDIGQIDESILITLLANVFDTYTESAKNIATSTTATTDSAGNYTNARGREIHDNVSEGTYVLTSEQWDALHPAMIEFITDLKYQGGTYLWGRVAKVNEALIENDGDQLEQFKAVRDLFTGDYFDDYMDNLGLNRVSSDISETFYGQSTDLQGEHRRNQIRLAFLNYVISALESGKDVIVVSPEDENADADAAADTNQESQTSTIENIETEVTESNSQSSNSSSESSSSEAGVPVMQSGVTYYYIVESGFGNDAIATKFGVSRDAIESANSDLYRQRGEKGYFWVDDRIIIPSPTQNFESLTSENSSIAEEEVSEIQSNVGVESTNSIDWKKIGTTALWLLSPGIALGTALGRGIANLNSGNDSETQDQTDVQETTISETESEQSSNNVYNQQARDEAIQFIKDNKFAYLKGFEQWNSGNINDQSYNSILLVHKDNSDGEGDHLKVYRNFDFSTRYYHLVYKETLTDEQFESAKQSMAEAKGVEVENLSTQTYCNIATTAIAEYYGATNLQRYNGQEFNANGIFDNLETGFYNTETHEYKNVDYSQAEAYARNGGFSIVTIKSGIGHIATLTGGFGGDGDQEIRNLNIFQAGASFGDMTYSQGFGNLEPTFYIWIRKDNGESSDEQPVNNEGSEQTVNIESIARIVYEGMNGAGTDEEAVYNALALLNFDQALIDALKIKYQELFDQDIVEDIEGDFSNSWLFGNQLDKALEFLNINSNSTSETTNQTEETIDPDQPISASVGLGGVNKAKDVRVIQTNLLLLGYLQNSDEINLAAQTTDDEILNELPDTIEAIKFYQKFGLGIPDPDGRVDVDGYTYTNMVTRLTMIQEYSENTIETSPIAPVLDTSDWISQFSSDASKNGDGRGLLESEKAYEGKDNNMCCWDAACAMIVQNGGSIQHEVTSRIPTLLQQNSEDITLNRQTELGVKYIDEQLLAGNPVLLGVDDGRVETYNSDATTEHFIVVMAKVITDNKVYYRFFDPGTSWGANKGYNENNLLLLGEDYSLTGSKPGSDRTYTVSQVRQNN